MACRAVGSHPGASGGPGSGSGLWLGPGSGLWLGSASWLTPGGRGPRPHCRRGPEWPEAGGNGRLWRRLDRAPEAAAGRPVGRPLPLGGPGCSGPPGAPCGGTGAELGRCQEGRFDHAGGTWPPLPVEDPAAREPGGGGAMSESRRFCSSWSHARTSSSVASAAKVWRSAPSSVRRESVLVVPEPEEGAWAWTAREAR